MIWLVIRTIIRHLLRDLEARHTLAYDVAHSLAHDTAYDSPVIRPTPGGKRSACPAFCRQAGHFFTVPPQICDAFCITICGIFLRFSHQQGVRRLALATRVRWPCPAVPLWRATGQNESRHAAAYAVGSRKKCRFGTCSVPACHFFVFTGPHSRNIPLIESGFAARWAPQVPAGP